MSVSQGAERGPGQIVHAASAGWAGLAGTADGGHVPVMALTSVYLAEEALGLPAEERAALGRLLLASVEVGGPSDEEIRAELRDRLERVRSGEDKGLSFDELFGEPA